MAQEHALTELEERLAQRCCLTRESVGHAHLILTSVADDCPVKVAELPIMGQAAETSHAESLRAVMVPRFATGCGSAQSNDVAVFTPGAKEQRRDLAPLKDNPGNAILSAQSLVTAAQDIASHRDCRDKARLQAAASASIPVSQHRRLSADAVLAPTPFRCDGSAG